MAYFFRAVTVEICVFVGQESIVVAFWVDVAVSGVVKGHEVLLLLSSTHIFDGISRPHLPLLYYSSRRHHAVRCNDGSLLQNSSLENDRVVTNVHSLFDGAGVKGAIILDDIIALEQQFSPETGGRGGSGMEDAIIANADVVNQSALSSEYVTRFTSPRMTVPCHMAISAPMKTSPTTVALGATKMKPSL